MGIHTKLGFGSGLNKKHGCEADSGDSDSKHRISDFCFSRLDLKIFLQPVFSLNIQYNLRLSIYPLLAIFAH
jgi:hypothetical protein